MENKEKVQDKLFDFEGNITQQKFNVKKTVAAFALVALVMLICSLLPLSQYGEKCGLALGFFISFIILLLLAPWNILVNTMILVVGGYFFGFWTWSEFQTSTATSSALQLAAMSLVGLGAESTPIGRRIALHMLKWLGDRPVTLCIAAGVASAIMSVFVSNLATLIVISSICNVILLTLDEKPGQSRLGRAVMLIIPMASYVAGCTLISSSPGGNVYGISLLQAVSSSGATISYTDWAKLGIPCFIVGVIPAILIYIFFIGVKNTDVKNVPPKSYYDGLIAEMGPLGGSEIRWLIIVMGMIVALLCGGQGTAIPLLFAAISLMPVIGTVPLKGLFSKLPMLVIVTIYLMSPIGLLFSNTGLSDFVVDTVTPLVAGLTPLALCLVMSLTQGILTNVLVNSNGAIMAALIGVTVPLCEKLGYNPIFIVYAITCTGSLFFGNMYNTVMLTNKEYGWWEAKDAVVPGFVTVIFLCVAWSITTYLVAPILGISIYV